MQHEESFTVIVNLEKKTVPDRRVTFDEVVRLAFPDKASDLNTTFTVTFRKSDSNKRDGTLVEGEHVQVKKDGSTSFTVVHATKS